MYTYLSHDLCKKHYSFLLLFFKEFKLNITQALTESDIFTKETASHKTKQLMSTLLSPWIHGPASCNKQSWLVSFQQQFILKVYINLSL